MEKPTIFSSAPRPPKQIRVEEPATETNVEKQDMPEKKEEEPSTITVLQPTAPKNTVVKLNTASAPEDGENTKKVENTLPPTENNTETKPTSEIEIATNVTAGDSATDEGPNKTGHFSLGADVQLSQEAKVENATVAGSMDNTDTASIAETEIREGSEDNATAEKPNAATDATGDIGTAPKNEKAVDEKKVLTDIQPEAANVDSRAGEASDIDINEGQENTDIEPQTAIDEETPVIDKQESLKTNGNEEYAIETPQPANNEEPPNNIELDKAEGQENVDIAPKTAIDVEAPIDTKQDGLKTDGNEDNAIETPQAENNEELPISTVFDKAEGQENTAIETQQTITEKNTQTNIEPADEKTELGEGAAIEPPQEITDIDAKGSENSLSIAEVEIDDIAAQNEIQATNTTVDIEPTGERNIEVDALKEQTTTETPLVENDNVLEGKTASETKPTEKTTRPSASKNRADVEYDFENLKIPGDDELFQRQYYTMGEVATMFHANQSQIRFWENEFDILQPKKNKKGDRYFRPEDVKNLQVIHHLLRNRRFTIEGAREYLKSNKQRTQDTVSAIAALGQLKSFLVELKANL